MRISRTSNTALKGRGALIHLAGVALLLTTWTANDLRAAEEPTDPDEQVLQNAKIYTDNASLVAYLRKQSQRDADLLRMDSLVRQLGSPSFQERQEASTKLRSLQLIALPALREARNNDDPEVAKRAEALVKQIEQDTQYSIPFAAVRLLLRRQAPGTGETLLQYLPFAGDPRVEEEIWFGLDSLITKGMMKKERLLAALKDALPARRALAACILARLGDASQRNAVRALLVDPDSHVRLRASQGLLAANDCGCLPTLTALLKVPDLSVAWQAEELLNYVAGDKSQKQTVGRGTEAEVTKSYQAWEEWRQSATPNLMEVRDKTSPAPRLILACGYKRDGRKLEGMACLLGSRGPPRWEMRQPREICDIELQPANHFLLAERDSTELGERDCPTDQVAARTADGTAIWTLPIAFGQQAPASRRLPNGSIFFFRGFDWLIFDADRRQRTPATAKPNPVMFGGGLAFAHLLDPNHVVFMPEFGKLTLTRADLTDKIRYQLLTMDTDSNQRGCRFVGIHNGKLILYFPRERSTLIQVGSSGRIDLKREIPLSFQVTLLRNGNVLSASFEPNPCVLESTIDGKIVWRALLPFTPYRAYECLGLVRLGFDNRPISK
jgi:hypothetical protein